MKRELYVNAVVTSLRRSLVLSVWLLHSLFSSAAEYVFVFHAGTAATVYETDDLAFVASPEVGAGAVNAIGVPCPELRTRRLKIYVLRTASVLVLDPEPPFPPRTVLPLQAAIHHGESSAILTPDDSRLIVAAQDFLHVFDAFDPLDPLPTVLDLGGPISGVAVPPNSDRAFVITEGSTEVRMVDLAADPPSLLPETLTLGVPLLEIPRAIGASPNGSGVYAASDSSVFEIDPVALEVTGTVAAELAGATTLGFDPDSPVPSAFVVADTRLQLVDLLPLERGREFGLGVAVGKTISPGGGLIHSIIGESARVVRAVIATGAIRVLNDPATGSGFPLPAVDIEAGPGGRSLVVAFGEPGLLVRVDVEGETKHGEIVPPAPPTGIAVLTDRGPFVSRAELYGGNGQVGVPGARLRRPLALRLVALGGRPVTGREVTFSSDEPGVVLSPTSIRANRFGVAHTFVTVPTVDPFEVEADFSLVSPSVFFDVNSGAEGTTGLRKVSGEYQVMLSGEPFPLPLVVEATADGEPVGGLELTITPSVGVTCPLTVETDPDGLIEIDCTAPVVGTEFPLSVDVKDSFGRSIPEPFRARAILDEDDLPTHLIITVPQPIVGVAGATRANAITGQVLTKGGSFARNVGVSFTSADDIFISTPISVVDSNGQVSSDLTFGCTLGPGAIMGMLQAADGDTEIAPFMVTTGSPASLEKTGGDGQSGVPGQLLNLAGQGLYAVLRDACAHPIVGEPVEWEANPAGAVEFDFVFRGRTTKESCSRAFDSAMSRGPLRSRHTPEA